MLCRESANVEQDAAALLVPFAQVEIFLPGMPCAGRCRKHKVVGGFYSEYQGHSLDTRDGLWGTCGPPEMECRIGSGCMLLGRESKASSRMSLRTTWVESWLGFMALWDGMVVGGISLQLPNTAEFCRCHFPPINVSNVWAWGWYRWNGGGLHGRAGGFSFPFPTNPTHFSFLAWKFYLDLQPGFLTVGKFHLISVFPFFLLFPLPSSLFKF